MMCHKKEREKRCIMSKAKTFFTVLATYINVIYFQNGLNVWMKCNGIRGKENSIKNEFSPVFARSLSPEMTKRIL